MIWNSSTGFFLAFQPFTPPQQDLAPQHKSRPCPGALQKSCQLLPDGSQTLAVSTIGRIKFHLRVRKNFPKSKDSPNKKICSWRKPKTGPELFFRSAQTDRYTEGLFPTNPSDCHATWDSLHLGDPPSVPCRAVRMVTSHPQKKQLLLSNTQIFHQPTFWPKKRTTEALGHHLNWLLSWNMFFSSCLKWPKKTSYKIQPLTFLTSQVPPNLYVLVAYV